MDTFTKTTSTSWFQRLGQSLAGILIGIVLVLGSIVLLFWNEGRTVKTARALEEGAGIVQTIDPKGDLVAANGKLVHFSGTFEPGGIASDDEFPGISAPEGAAALIRSVEMYQWRENQKSETRTKLGGGEETVTTYTYEKVWSDDAIDSSRFEKPESHANPPMPYESRTFEVTGGTVGSIELGPDAFGGLGSSKALPPTADMLSTIQAVTGSGQRVVLENGKVSIRRGDTDEIGALRIGYSVRTISDISAVGRLEGGRLTAYTASNGNEILLAEDGTASAQQMFDTAISGNAVIAWVLRLVGFIAMLIGFNLVFSVIGVAGDIIPLVGSLLRFATGIVAFALAAFGSLLVIGIAWFWYRPVLSLALIGGGVVIALVAMRFAKSRATSKAAAVAA
ncbi:TMEM43 family protein [Ciceribacter sp. L1K22]|uniref:TMEM43 family protein n=1 Tax=Ciceribacter sp. L1K22 TaxID=2820275 RepID=UPI001ABDFFE6|nr:TMEM43 family protein [Ciceribacter sp. L1K22]MBO3760411.1 TMEM43 family protein [Ciceribacter sp. L1K22]